jgi:hypothetical protein
MWMILVHRGGSQHKGTKSQRTQKRLGLAGRPHER